MVCRTDRMEKIEWYLSYRKWRAERNRRLREVAKEYVLAKNETGLCEHADSIHYV